MPIHYDLQGAYDSVNDQASDNKILTAFMLQLLIHTCCRALSSTCFFLQSACISSCKPCPKLICLIVHWGCNPSHFNQLISVLRLQVFYTFHIVGFVGFILFAFIHYQGMWQYTYPGRGSANYQHS